MNHASRLMGVATTLLLACSIGHAQLPAKVGDTPVPSLAPIIKKASPAVVNISIRGTVRQTYQNNPLFQDPFFRRFFDIPEQGPRERQFQSMGSGVIVDAKNGYVVTNAHVVQNAAEISVTLLDNREFKAEVVGKDPGSDIAILKIKADNLTAMPLADSSKAQVGDFVIAIGNPFGLQHTVTSGIISALGRVGITDGYEDFVQTDASINPGNSGGALVNLQGEVLGINTLIFSSSGGNIGIGFAIPANMVKSVMTQIVQYGEVRRGLLGVRIDTLTPDIAENLGIPNQRTGALVQQVEEGSAADRAGIRAGDVITAVNSKSVKTGAELRNMIGMMRVGDKIDVELIREGKTRRVSAIVGENQSATAASAEEIHMRLAGAELTDAENKSGVLVRSVAEGSPAAQLGLRANDVITTVGRTRVTTLAELRKAINGAEAFALTLRRGNANLMLVIR